jgi:NADH:ubiquinone reductase (H+-translocating)
MPKKQKILIVGGGFGGIKTALELADDKRFETILISDRDYFRYYPTLYHMATGGKLAESSINLAEIFDNKPVKVIKDTALSIDREQKILKTKNAKYDYDVVVLALGVITNYFNIKGLEQYAYGIKSIEEAQRLKNHLHQQLSDDSKPDINYIVVGGGPTGVELAGSLPGYVTHIMKKHNLKPTKLNVKLVEAADRVMPRMPRAYSIAVQKRLRKLGVQIALNQAVEAETADTLIVDGKPISSHTVVWTSGVANHPFFADNDFYITEHRKVSVNKYMEADEDTYVIGDNADTTYSGMAQTALYDAKFVANDIKLRLGGKPRKEYKPKKPIYVTPVGPRWAAMLWGKTQVYGLGAWLLRSAADFIAYKDLEPWWKAGRHWLAELGGEEDCRVCHPKLPK